MSNYGSMDDDQDRLIDAVVDLISSRSPAVARVREQMELRAATLQMARAELRFIDSLYKSKGYDSFPSEVREGLNELEYLMKRIQYWARSETKPLHEIGKGMRKYDSDLHKLSIVISTLGDAARQAWDQAMKELDR